MPTLLVRDPNGNEREHELLDEITTVGRGSQNIIQARDREASRQHCRIEKGPSGFRVVDNRSRNGTLVNGQKVDMHDLRPGDKITIGEFSMTFEPQAAVGDSEDEDFVGTVEVAPISEKELASPAAAGGASGKPQFVLDITEGAQKGQVLERGPETLTIGRGKANKCVINDESASNYHAEIVKEPTGYFVSDLGSTNGTKVGGEKIVKTRLSPGTEILIGNTKLVFKNLGAPAEEDEVFGTVLLDAEKLTSELAEDELRARAAFVRRIAAAAAVIGVCVGLYFLVAAIISSNGTTTTTVPGNLLRNASFDGPNDNTGNPAGWRCASGRYTTWSAERNMDRIAARDKETKAAVAVSRDPAARRAAYTECRPQTPGDVSRDKSYRLGGYISTEGAQGVYGFRVKWLGRPGERRTAVDQAYAMGSQTAWRHEKGVFTPPGWASRAEISCFAIGNMGKVYFDDGYFVAEGAARRTRRTKVFDRISAEFSRSGTFLIKSGAAAAVTGGEIFLVADQSATSTQKLAKAEEPSIDLNAIVFNGTIPEFETFDIVRYDQTGRAGELGVVLEYDLSAERAVGFARAGVRFVVTGSFGAGRTEAFDAAGPVEGTAGLIEGAREVVFTNSRGEQLAVYAPGDALLKIESRGTEKLVEVLVPGGVSIGRVPVRLAVEFNTKSRIERVGIKKLWTAYKAAGSLDARMKALGDIIAQSDRFPEDAEKASGLLATTGAAAESDFARARNLLKQLRASMKAEGVYMTILQQATEMILDLDRKYPTGDYAAKVRDLEVELQKIEADRKQWVRERQAKRIIAEIHNMLKDSPEIAKQLWDKLERDYSDTEAYKRAKADGLGDAINAEIKLRLRRGAALRSLQGKVRNFVINGMYRRALSVLEGDPEYQRFKDYPPIKDLIDEIRQKAAAQPVTP